MEVVFMLLALIPLGKSNSGELNGATKNKCVCAPPQYDNKTVSCLRKCTPGVVSGITIESLICSCRNNLKIMNGDKERLCLTGVWSGNSLVCGRRTALNKQHGQAKNSKTTRIPTTKNKKTKTQADYKSHIVRTTPLPMQSSTGSGQTSLQVCRCNKNIIKPKNIKTDIKDAMKKIKIRQKELKLDTVKTSKYRRKKISIADTRTSATAIGFVFGMGILSVGVLLIIIPDTLIVYQQFTQALTLRKFQ